MQAVLPIIRVNNSNRIVILGGLQWMNPNWQTQHPASMKIPSGDPQLMLEVHNYDRKQWQTPLHSVKSECKWFIENVF